MAWRSKAVSAWRRAWPSRPPRARSGSASATASMALSAVTGLSRHSAWNTSETTHGTFLNQFSSLAALARAPHLTLDALQQALNARSGLVARQAYVLVEAAALAASAPESGL